MSTNQHIDALLVGAVYGELSPTEQAELSAHLLANPADADVLARLQQARGLVRHESFRLVEPEPPQAVSARLLQEAARKAPARSFVAKPEEGKGWFTRWIGFLAARPALAAAASLALLAGVGGVLYSRGGAKLAETTASSQPDVKSAPEQAPPAAVANPQLAQDEGRKGSLAAGSAAALPDDSREPNAADGKDLAEDKNRGGEGGDGISARIADDETPVRRMDSQKKEAEIAAVADRKPTPKMATKADVANNERAGAKAKAPLETGEADGFDYKAPVTNAISGGSIDDADVTVNQPREEQTRPSKPAVKKPAPTPVTLGGAGSTGQSAPTLYIPSAQGKAANQQPPPPPAAPTSPPKDVAQDPAAVAKETADKPIVDASTIEAKKRASENQWAITEHAKLKKLVAAGKCSEAGKLGAAIAARVPDYYQQNIANDRAVQSCAAYIRDSRAQEAEKNRKSTKPTKAPSPINSPDSK